MFLAIQTFFPQRLGISHKPWIESNGVCFVSKFDAVQYSNAIYECNIYCTQFNICNIEMPLYVDFKQLPYLFCQNADV